MKLSVKNMSRVFARILLMSREDREFICSHFNEVLDDMRVHEMFGTEGQLDPRRHRK